MTLKKVREEIKKQIQEDPEAMKDELLEMANDISEDVARWMVDNASEEGQEIIDADPKEVGRRSKKAAMAIVELITA